MGSIFAQDCLSQSLCGFMQLGSIDSNGYGY